MYGKCSLCDLMCDSDEIFLILYSRPPWKCVAMCVERPMCWLKMRRACGIALMRVNVIRMRVWGGLYVVIVWRVCVCVRSTV